LPKRVDPTDRSVEFWMSELEQKMLGGVREAFMHGVETYPETVRTQWVKEHPGQIVLNAS